MLCVNKEQSRGGISSSRRYERLIKKLFSSFSVGTLWGMWTLSEKEKHRAMKFFSTKDECWIHTITLLVYWYYMNSVASVTCWMKQRKSLRKMPRKTNQVNNFCLNVARHRGLTDADVFLRRLSVLNLFNICWVYLNPRRDCQRSTQRASSLSWELECECQPDRRIEKQLKYFERDVFFLI